jgi:hypothetical protein
MPTRIAAPAQVTQSAVVSISDAQLISVPVVSQELDDLRVGLCRKGNVFRVFVVGLFLLVLPVAILLPETYGLAKLKEDLNATINWIGCYRFDCMHG